MSDRYTVLVVDDDVSIVRLLVYVLEAEGYATRAAYSGAEALASVAADPPDLILLDLAMPNLDGVSVVKRLLAGAYAHIPVIVTSASMPRRLVRNAANVVAFFEKPFDLDMLVSSVEQSLRQSRAAGTAGEQTREHGA